MFMDIFKNTQDGRKTGFKIFNQSQELKRIDPFFKNEEIFYKKPTLIKTNDYSDKNFREYFIYMSEVDTTKQMLKHQHILENKHAEVENRKREESKKKSLIFNTLFEDFKKEIEKVDVYSLEITDFVKMFIDNKKSNTTSGEFQYFVSYIVKKYNTKKRITVLEETYFNDCDNKKIYFNKIKILR
jgi:hypothetical protein